MRVLRQMFWISFFSLAGEIARWFLPLPVPAAVYGLVFLFLAWGLLPVSAVQETGQFLLALMPILFVSPTITTAMGIVVSEMHGGDTAITTVVIIITGVLGSICGPGLCRVLHLHHPAARGTAFGTASHVIGTARVAGYGEMDKAVGSLSLVVAGILTVIAVPAFIPML